MTRSILVALTIIVTLAACQDETADGAETPELPAAEAAVEPEGSEEAVPVEQGLLDPNDASREQLIALPGFGEEAADALVSGRPYDDMVAVDRVLADHLSEEEREAVYRGLWKPLKLNEASEEEILLIPGVGPRMAHEFDEYRPYRGIEEFRRQIGKYVDEETVAGWEPYITIP